MKRSIGTLILALSGCLSACGQVQGGGSETAQSNTDDVLPSLQRAYEYWQTLPPNALVVIHDGEVIAEWGEVDTKVKLSSVRKSLLSALYGIYVNEGVVDLDSTLEELEIDDEPEPLSDVEKTATVRMLLQARSGIYHGYAGGTPAMLANQPARDSHAPGSFWYYNNWDFNALGTIFEKLVGRPIGTDFEERIARPIGMQDFRATDVYYRSDEQSAHRQYHFRMTARDVARFGELMRLNGMWEGNSVIPAEWVAESTSLYSDAGARGGYGYLWWVAKDGVLYPGVDLPEGSYAALGAVGKYLPIIPDRRLVISHIQLREWPDNAAELSASELPGPDDSTSAAQMGELVSLILDAIP